MPEKSDEKRQKVTPKNVTLGLSDPARAAPEGV